MPGQVGGIQQVSAAALRAEAVERGDVALPYLPFLGLDGYIVRGWSHIIAGYPKAGKTELITRLCLEWQEERILYFTEEPQSAWGLRLARLPDAWSHMTLAFALGAKPDAVLTAIAQSDATVIVIDTVRNLLNIRDETDNSEVARVLNPFIAACRDRGKTLLLAHHLRKGGGEHGEGITGGHAFLGVVDIALELDFGDGNAEKRRRVRGQGRIIGIQEVIYEWGEDNLFIPLGSPDVVALETVKERILEVLNGDWQTLAEIREGLDEPKPSKRQMRDALGELVDRGRIERDPPEGGRGKTFRYRLSATETLPGIGLLNMPGQVVDNNLPLEDDL